MDVVLLIGRVLFGVLFVYSGIGHFAAGEAMQGYAPPAGRARAGADGADDRGDPLERDRRDPRRPARPGSAHDRRNRPLGLAACCRPFWWSAGRMAATVGRRPALARSGPALRRRHRPLPAPLDREARTRTIAEIARVLLPGGRLDRHGGVSPACCPRRAHPPAGAGQACTRSIRATSSSPPGSSRSAHGSCATAGLALRSRGVARRRAGS